MKFTPKHAFAALAIAMASQAGAQVIHDLPESGNSSFYFLAQDEVASRSYFAEMVANAGSTTTGVLHLDDLISNPTGSWTVTLSGLNTFAAGSASLNDLFGGFGAADTNGSLGGGGTPATGARRIVTSIAAGGAKPSYSNSAVASAGTAFNTFAATVNNASVCGSNPCIATNGAQVQYTSTNNGNIGLQWGNPASALIGTALSGTVAWDIYLAATASSVPSLQSSVTLLALHAVLDLSNNLLTISGPTSAVPVPAAVWLLGSAMLGFVGIGRRKKGKADEQIADGLAAA